MSDSWRQTMMNITDRIFPSLPPGENVGYAFSMYQFNILLLK